MSPNESTSKPAPMPSGDSSAPPMWLFTLLVVLLVQAAWHLRELYLPALTAAVTAFGFRYHLY